MDRKLLTPHFPGEKYPDLITSTAGLGDVIELGVTGIPSWGRVTYNRRAITLEMSTYIGISSDAVHYYGKLVVDGVYTATLGNIAKPKSLQHEVVLNYPLLNYKYNFDIKRVIKQAEIDSDPKRYEGLEDGDYTTRFNTAQELIDHTREIIKERFKGDWMFVICFPRMPEVRENITF